LWRNIWSVVENVPCVLEKNVYYHAVGWNDLYLFVSSIWLMCSSSPIFPYWLSIRMIYPLLKTGYLSSLLLLYCCLFQSSDLLIIIYIYYCYSLLVSRPSYHYIMTFFVSQYSFWLKVYFVWDKYRYPCFFLPGTFFFCPFTFSPWVPLKLKWISFRHHIVGSCFFIYLATLCLLIGEFKPFAFKILTDMAKLPSQKLELLYIPAYIMRMFFSSHFANSGTLIFGLFYKSKKSLFSPFFILTCFLVFLNCFSDVWLISSWQRTQAIEISLKKWESVTVVKFLGIWKTRCYFSIFLFKCESVHAGASKWHHFC